MVKWSKNRKEYNMRFEIKRTKENKTSEKPQQGQ